MREALVLKCIDGFLRFGCGAAAGLAESLHADPLGLLGNQRQGKSTTHRRGQQHGTLDLELVENAASQPSGNG